ncbi:MAG: DUF5717 family protein, partial [Clostridiales bacterium]|nr:DUF5717 family protein [Clostridiales bacterium]
MLAQFEYPLPELSADIDEIEAETHSVYEGSFFIRNTGGGRLSGRITPRNACAEFTPTEFDGPRRVYYRISAEGYSAGDVIRTGAVLTSNGGEKYIPITLTITAASIQTDEGVTITTMRSFADYARRYPDSAADLLNTLDFRRLLQRNRFEFMNAYEHILSDKDRPRALECLLRLSGLKKAAKINALQKHTEVRLNPFQREVYFGRIPIQKEGWGYIEDKVFAKNGSRWLKPLSTVASALEESGMFNFSIDPSKLPGRYASDSLVFAENPEAEAVITAIRQPYFKARTNKESY